MEQGAKANETKPANTKILAELEIKNLYNLDEKLLFYGKLIANANCAASGWSTAFPLRARCNDGSISDTK